MRYYVVGMSTTNVMGALLSLGINPHSVQPVASANQLKCLAQGTTIYTNTSHEKHPQWNQIYQLVLLRNYRLVPLPVLANKLAMEGKLQCPKTAT